MKAQAYLDMMKRQQQELTDFPIAYAFNEKQLHCCGERRVGPSYSVNKNDERIRDRYF